MPKKRPTVQLECPNCKVQLTIRAETIDEVRNCWRCNTKMVLPEKVSKSDPPAVLPLEDEDETADAAQPQLANPMIKSPIGQPPLQDQHASPAGAVSEARQPASDSQSSPDDRTVPEHIAANVQSTSGLETPDASTIVAHETATPTGKSEIASVQPTQEVDLDELIQVPDYDEEAYISPAKQKEIEEAKRMAELEEDDFDIFAEAPKTLDVTKPGWKLDKKKAWKREEESPQDDKNDLDAEDDTSSKTETDYESNLSPIKLSEDPLDAIEISQVNEDIPEKPQPKDPQPIREFGDEKKTQFRFDCLICNAMIYATEDKVGTEVLCPDCDSVMTVPTPTKKMFVKEQPGTHVHDPLSTSQNDDEDELQLSDPIELPKYKSNITDNDLDAIKFEDPPALQTEQTEHNEAELAAAKDAKARQNEVDLLAPIPVPKKKEGDGHEVVTPLESKKEKQPLDSEKVESQPKDGQTKKTSRKERLSEIEAESDFVKPEINEDRWFLEMLVFFKDIHVLARLFFISLLIGVGLYLVSFISSCNEAGSFWVMIGFALWVPTMFLTFVTACVLFVSASSIIESTSTGRRHIEGWVEFSISEWLSRSLGFFAATFVGGLPGFIFAQPFACAGISYLIILPLAMLISFWALFPFCLISTMENQSPWSIYSSTIAESMTTGRNLWKSFYGQTAVLAICALPLVFFCILPNFLVQLIGALGVSILLLMYFRLLGYHAFRLTEFLKTQGK